ncbi:hypothetical protein NC651_030679 [Populus alba x Populus x berolinensis]|nr:hypothetical protein NC651_030679 [Populus alba x Populus x berolinensis]
MVGQTILVTGGAGFFGTHTVVQLLNEGFKVSIIDNHDNCVTEAVDCVKELVDPQLSKNLEFNLGDLRKKDDLEKLFSRIKFDAVIPFSGLKAVGESVADPRRYFDNNLVGTINLYEVMAKHNWKKVYQCVSLFNYFCMVVSLWSLRLIYMETNCTARRILI